VGVEWEKQFFAEERAGVRRCQIFLHFAFCLFPQVGFDLYPSFSKLPLAAFSRL
jgi:hypothetical protein